MALYDSSFFINNEAAVFIENLRPPTSRKKYYSTLRSINRYLVLIPFRISVRDTLAFCAPVTCECADVVKKIIDGFLFKPTSHFVAQAITHGFNYTMVHQAPEVPCVIPRRDILEMAGRLHFGTLATTITLCTAY